MTFADFFRCATGHAHFPWQLNLYEKFAAGDFPSNAIIPTGLGKTSVIAVWLIALALHQEKVPRRLVYVVNRRTVVDQTTAEVEKLRKALLDQPDLKEIANQLRALCALPLPSPDSAPLAVSTLRGQFADNREWSADPARPAVIIGTVDMIGSGLLFSRYTVGFKLRPHHAALLAQDALLVHDEAHLEPAFQKLLDSIVVEQNRSNDPRKLRVIELTATTRSDASIETFKITENDEKNDFVYQRLNAVKKLTLVELGDGEKEQDKIIELAFAYQETGRAILVFVHSVESATKIAADLGKKAGIEKVRTLTGTMRGKERDELVTQPLFKRFLPNDKSENDDTGTVWLVATSAGEVGVNISADDLICDLSTYESMAQRLGRVNRFGERDDSTITVVHPSFFGKKDKNNNLVQSDIDIAHERTLGLLQKLEANAHPAALEKLSTSERAAAFSPPPKLRMATAVQFDAWALTSIRKPIAARPPVAPYLHGEADEWQPAETHVAWRDDPDIIRDGMLTSYPPEGLLEDFPLKPHELLRDTTKRIAETLSALIEQLVQNGKDIDAPEKLPAAWVLREDGTIEPLPLIPSVQLFKTYKKQKERNASEKDEIKRHKESLKFSLGSATLILPASIGGVSEQGLLTADGKADRADVSEIKNARFRLRAPSPDIPVEYASDYRLIRVIDTQLGDEGDDLESPTRYWLWLEAKNSVNAEKRFAVQPETLKMHTEATAANAIAIAEKLFPMQRDGQPDLRIPVSIAAKLHDPGKDRRFWQLGIGNTGYDPSKPDTILAKSGSHMRRRNLAEHYRHEFGSLTNATASTDFAALSPAERDIVLHLIAAHHGRARPHFPEDEIFDYDSSPADSLALATEIPRRFARLQRRFGRWGLAWLESILRAADYAASAGIIAEKSAIRNQSTISLPAQEKNAISQQPGETTIVLRADVANPGHFFACCGLFELASCLAPDVLAYFKQDTGTKQWRFLITGAVEKNRSILTLSSLLTRISETEITAIEPADVKMTALGFGNPFNMVVDWWRYEGGPIGKLKPWAGQMSVFSIANDMKQALKKEIAYHAGNLENILFVPSVANAGQPYYFDANYAVNAQSQDVGFSVDKLGKGGFKLKTVTMPAVELLCLIGLERARPLLSVDEKGKERFYDYRVWDTPLPSSLIPAVIAGVLPINHQRLRFSNPSRARDYRAFMPAIFL